MPITITIAGVTYDLSGNVSLTEISPPVPPVPPPPIPPPPIPPPPVPPPPPPVPVVDTNDSRVTVSATQIVTPDDTIPIPQTGNILTIAVGTTRDWTTVDDTRYDAVLVYGTLKFPRTAATRLRATTVIVFPGGTLDMGTASDPITAKAELIFNDVPLDLTVDPNQYQHGLIVLGTFTAFGLVKDGFIRLATEPKAGDTTLTLSVVPVGWKVGDNLIVPDTRQLFGEQRWGNFVPQWERATIASINGNVVGLSDPLAFDHLASRDKNGVVAFTPHVGNLTRNIVVRSENASGTRGHVMFTRRAWVDVSGVQFSGLGRTKLGTIDASNPMGRYPVHFHHCYGPVTAPTGRPQFSLRNCSVFCPLDPMPYKWGVVIHDSHFGEVKNNVIFNWGGAGVVTETGNETENRVEGNFVVGIRGPSSPRSNNGQDGSAFWLNGFNHRIKNNVAASAAGTTQEIVTGSGFNLFCPPAGAEHTPIPTGPGADTGVSFTLVDRQLQPILEFSGNEAYGCMATGLTLWNLGTDGYVDRAVSPSIIANFTAWHCYEEGFFGYPISKVTFDGFVVRGDPALAASNYSRGGGWCNGDYAAYNITIRNADIQGMAYGFYQTENSQGVMEINDSYFCNYWSNIDIRQLATPGGRSTIHPRVTNIRNCRYEQYPGSPGLVTIRTVYGEASGGINYIQSDKTFVYDHNGVTGDNFRVYYPQQDAAFIVPQTTYYGPDNNGDGIPDLIDSQGVPVAGLTNAQALAQYGVCIAGEILPAGSVSRSGIEGLVN